MFNEHEPGTRYTRKNPRPLQSVGVLPTSDDGAHSPVPSTQRVDYGSPSGNVRRVRGIGARAAARERELLAMVMAAEEEEEERADYSTTYARSFAVDEGNLPRGFRTAWVWALSLAWRWLDDSCCCVFLSVQPRLLVSFFQCCCVALEPTPFSSLVLLYPHRPSSQLIVLTSPFPPSSFSLACVPGWTSATDPSAFANIPDEPITVWRQKADRVGSASTSANPFGRNAGFTQPIDEYNRDYTKVEEEASAAATRTNLVAHRFEGAQPAPSFEPGTSNSY